MSFENIKKYGYVAIAGGTVLAIVPAQTFAAVVDGSGNVSLTPAELQGVGEGAANAAGSQLGNFATLAPKFFIFIAVGLVIGIITKLMKRK